MFSKAKVDDIKNFITDRDETIAFEEVYLSKSNKKSTAANKSCCT